MEELLKHHESLFEKPQKLPPQRSHDHQILLQPGAGLVSVKPYRYPFYQKTEIEEQVEDML